MIRTGLFLVFCTGILLSAFGQEKENQQSPEQRQKINNKRQRKAQPHPGLKKRKRSSVDVKEPELEQFVQAASEVKQIHQKSNQRKRKIIQKQDLTLQRYKQIVRNKRNPQRTDTFQLSEEERVRFEATQKQLKQEAKQTRQKIRSAIKDNGLKVKRYQKIMRGLKTDRELRKRFRKKMDNRGEEKRETSDK